MAVPELRAIGFCGADDSVSPEILDAISAKYPWIEWGVLFRAEKAGTPRFASAAWLERLRVVNARRQLKLAGHFCSSHCEAVLRGDASQAARAAMGDDAAGSSDPFAGQLRRFLAAGGAADGATNSIVFP